MPCSSSFAPNWLLRFMGLCITSIGSRVVDGWFILSHSTSFSRKYTYLLEMAARGSVQRPNGTSQGKICQFKLVLLGESAVGKSSLVLRFVKGQFHEYQESTIGGQAAWILLSDILGIICLPSAITLSTKPLSHIYSCFPDTNCLSGWHNSQVWDLGYCWSGEVSQSRSNVLQGRTGSHHSLRYHKPSKHAVNSMY